MIQHVNYAITFLQHYYNSLKTPLLDKFVAYLMMNSQILFNTMAKQKAPDARLSVC
jgi:hypothetical protein